MSFESSFSYSLTQLFKLSKKSSLQNIPRKKKMNLWNFFQFYTAEITLLMMTAESMLSKHPVLRITVTLFFLLKLFVFSNVVLKCYFHIIFNRPVICVANRRDFVKVANFLVNQKESKIFSVSLEFSAIFNIYTEKNYSTLQFLL